MWLVNYWNSKYVGNTTLKWAGASPVLVTSSLFVVCKSVEYASGEQAESDCDQNDSPLILTRVSYALPEGG